MLQTFLQILVCSVVQNTKLSTGVTTAIFKNSSGGRLAGSEECSTLNFAVVSLSLTMGGATTYKSFKKIKSKIKINVNK